MLLDPFLYRVPALVYVLPVSVPLVVPVVVPPVGRVVWSVKL